MKSSKFALIALVTSLALGTAAFAKGPMGGQAGGAGTGSSAGASAGASAGGQARSHNPGVGTATRTQARDQAKTQSEDQIRARLHTMSADGVPATGTGPGAGTGTPRGIHTPGTGLVADPATTPAAVAQ